MASLFMVLVLCTFPILSYCMRVSCCFPSIEAMQQAVNDAVIDPSLQSTAHQRWKQPTIQTSCHLRFPHVQHRIPLSESTKLNVCVDRACFRRFHTCTCKTCFVIEVDDVQMRTPSCRRMCCAQCQALRKAPRSAVCIRTLTVSKGCPAVTFAAPAAAPPNPSSMARTSRCDVRTDSSSWSPAGIPSEVQEGMERSINMQVC